MKPSLPFLLAALALPALAHASSFQTHTSLFNDFSLFGGINAENLEEATNFDTPVGTGILRYNGPRLEDGYHDFADVAQLSFFSIDITLMINEVSYTFDESHISSNAADLQIYLANDAFHFSGTGTGPTGSSMNYINGSTSLAFSPRGFAAFAYVLFETEGGVGSAFATGLYGTTETAYQGSAIPEPAGAAALAGLAILGLAATRRRRAA